MKARLLRTRASAALAIGLLFLLTGCGGGGERSAPPSPAPVTVSPPSDPTTQKTAVSEAEYASIASIPLRVIGASPGVTTSQVQLVSGPATNLVVVNGDIRFATPSDPGFDGYVNLAVQDGNATISVEVTILSSRPVAITQVIEPDEAGQTAQPSASQLLVTGLGENNLLLPGELRFTANDAPAFDPDASSATIFAPSSGLVVDLAKSWTLDAATNTFILSGAAFTPLFNSLPSGELDIAIGLASADGKYAQAWNFVGYKPSASLTVQVIDLNGVSSGAAAGKLMAVRGSDNHVRLVVPIDANGTAKASNLPAGTFELSILDVQQPGFWTATVPIFVGSTTVNASLMYAPEGIASPTSQKSGGAKAISVGVQQDGIPPQPRAFETSHPSSNGNQKATPSSCETVGTTAGESVYEAVAGAQATTISCLASHTFPQGTAKASVALTVSTAEFPVYTQSKSKYNDAWSYAVSGLKGLGSASGLVNDSHYTQGSTTKSVCIDVSELTKAGPYTFNASLSATNVGDSSLATRVVMDVKVSCEGDLKVTSATFWSPNKKTYKVVSPAPSGNLAGHYVSIPHKTEYLDWGIPLDVSFEPPDVTITSVRIGVMVGNAAALSDADVLSMVTLKAPGVLTFGDLRIPKMPIAPFAGKTNVVVELTGTTPAGETVKSKAEDGPITFAGDSTYYPLFLASDLFPASRRYGQDFPDAGGDSWTTFNTIGWLSARSAYRFNDTSALQLAAIPAGKSAISGLPKARSVLGHSGHSDGSQIDLRYADGSGGFTEPLGGAAEGASIKAMLDAAALEVAAGGSKGTAQLQATISWVNANRGLIQAEAVNASVIYFGNSFIQLALVSGKLPNGTPIPLIGPDGTLGGALGRWANKPAVARPIDAHLNHWHISLKSQ